jgi:hypothetical protein
VVTGSKIKGAKNGRSVQVSDEVIYGWHEVLFSSDCLVGFTHVDTYTYFT